MPDSVVASPQSFASYVYQQRYEPLFPLDGLYMREKRRTFTCFQDQPEILATLIQKWVDKCDKHVIFVFVIMLFLSQVGPRWRSEGC
jgi:hypothetical protein